MLKAFTNLLLGCSLLGATALAQTQINLGTQVRGVLPPANGGFDYAALGALDARRSYFVPNILDASKLTPNAALNVDGTLSTGAPSNYQVTDFMYVAGAPGIIANFPIGRYISQTSTVWYDKNKTVIGFDAGDGDHPANTFLAAPTGAVWARLYTDSSFGGIATNAIMVNAATTLSSTVVSYGYDAPSIVDSKIASSASTVTGGLNASFALQNASIAAEQVAYTKNIFDKENVQHGYTLRDDGTLVAKPNVNVSNFMKVYGSTSFVSSCSVSFNTSEAVDFYDLNKTLIGNYNAKTLYGMDTLAPGTSIPVPVTIGGVPVFYARWEYVTYNAGCLDVTAIMANTGTTVASYVGFGFYPPNIADAKIAANGVVRESRRASVQVIDPASVAPGASITIFTATGAGSVERIQSVEESNAGDADYSLENAVITITVDGNSFSSTYGMFFLSIGYSDGDAGADLFASKYLSVNNQGSQGGARRIYIPYTTSCTIALSNPAGSSRTQQYYTNVEYYPGATPVGLRDARMKVFHMETHEWFPSSYAGGATVPIITTAGAGAGVVDGIYFASSSANADGTSRPTWLEAKPTITLDGSDFAYGGSEDFYGAQNYAISSRPRSDEYGVARYGWPGVVGSPFYWTGYRYFHDFPLVFQTSVAAHTTAGLVGYAFPNSNTTIKIGTQAVWYTAQ